MADRIFDSWLERQREEGIALASESDLLELTPGGGGPPTRYVAHFRCKGLVRAPGRDGAVELAGHEDFGAGVWFPPDHLRNTKPNGFMITKWLWPRNAFHPNISDRAPLICVGHIRAGVGLVELLYQIFEIITYKKVTMNERDALNNEACAWARENLERFPVDTRPLKRRKLALSVTMKPSGGQERSAAVRR